MRIHVDFEHPFPGTPNIVCCTQAEPGTDYGDTFGCTVINPTPEGFDVNVGRQHPETMSWGQNLRLNYFAVYSQNSIDPIQTGVLEVGSKGDEDVESLLVTIEFPTPFPRQPVVICTPIGDDYPDSFGCTLRNVTNASAEVLLARTAPQCTSWGQELKLAWVASDDWPSMQVEVGSFDGGEDGQCMTTHEYPGGGRVKEPLLFVVAQHEGGSEYPDSMVCAVSAVEKDCFQLNMSRVHPEARGWGQQMRCHVVIVS